MGNHFDIKHNKKQKYCPKCDKWLSLSRFYKTKYHKSGRRSYCKKCGQDYQRQKVILWRYGLTKETYNNMLIKQKYKCAICFIKLDSSRLGLVPSIDHCHNTGITRGILCGGCNMVLGHAKDNILVLKNAIKYLKKRK